MLFFLYILCCFFYTFCVFFFYISSAHFVFCFCKFYVTFSYILCCFFCTFFLVSGTLKWAPRCRKTPVSLRRFFFVEKKTCTKYAGRGALKLTSNSVHFHLNSCQNLPLFRQTGNNYIRCARGWRLSA